LRLHPIQGFLYPHPALYSICLELSKGNTVFPHITESDLQSNPLRGTSKLVSGTHRPKRFIVSPSIERRRKGKVVVNEMNAKKREKYEPKRVFLETLTGYIEAARVRTLDQW
jgi:hypothetical protein